MTDTDPTYDDPELHVRLQTWAVEGAPDGFAERVMARTMQDPAGTPPVRRRVQWRLAAAAAALLATGAIVGSWADRAVDTTHHAGIASKGTRALNPGESFEIGKRAVAVGERAAEFSYDVAQSGATRISQRSGRVFYRVDEGEAFEVHTAAGKIRVLGTCFSVDIEEQTEMNRKTIVSGAVGAAIASAVVVTVYEGQVLAENTHGEAAVGQGDAARLTSDAAPTSTSTRGGTPAANVDGASDSATVAELRARLARQTRELERLRSQQGENSDERSDEPSDERKGGSLGEMDLSCAKRITANGYDCPMQGRPQAVLERMAECGAVIDEVPQFLVDESFAGSAFLSAEGDLDEAEVKAIDALSSRYRDQQLDAIRRDLEALRDEPGFAADLSARELLSLARMHVDPVAREVANERAGFSQPPPPDALGPSERLGRRYLEFGNTYERALAEHLGADRAHDLRLLHDGFRGSRGIFSSGGCPDE